MNQKKWSFWIDRGGTFTDIVAKSPENKIVVKKFLSQNHKVYKDAASFGILNILDEYNQLNNNISSCVDEIKMGTTVATNALLERKGEKTLLVITKGFRDALEIAYQDRSNIFAKNQLNHRTYTKKYLKLMKELIAMGIF